LYTLKQQPSKLFILFKIHLQLLFISSLYTSQTIKKQKQCLQFASDRNVTVTKEGVYKWSNQREVMCESAFVLHPHSLFYQTNTRKLDYNLKGLKYRLLRNNASWKDKSFELDYACDSLVVCTAQNKTNYKNYPRLDLVFHSQKI
jgi:hypothetical protein